MRRHYSEPGTYEYRGSSTSDPSGNDAGIFTENSEEEWISILDQLFQDHESRQADRSGGMVFH
jgi:hypothetical protein